jgi:hypothetical protein
MRIALSTAVRKSVFAGITLLAAASLAGSSLLRYLADHLAHKGDLRSLQLAARLTPDNATYQDQLGRYSLFFEASPTDALRFYRRAENLSHQAAYPWLDEANVRGLLGDSAGQEAALEHALEVEPTDSTTAWLAANLLFARGKNQQALLELHHVMEADPSRGPEALELAIKIDPDVPSLLQNVLPPQPPLYWQFLDYLNSNHRDADAFAVWTRLVRLQQPMERQRVFGYVEYLLSRHDVSRAQLVWQQASPFCSLAGYQPGDSNLVVNGEFALDILNTGFDWRYQTQPEVALSLDPTEPHGSQRSLLIRFTGQPVGEVGLRQLIPVRANSNYRFSAFSKTQELQGAGGPRFVLQDAFNDTVYYSGEALSGSGSWKESTGRFRTGAETQLLSLRIIRVPQGATIRGKLWISSVRLTPDSGAEPL